MKSDRRDSELRMARIYIVEARSRRASPYLHQRNFGITLLNWAAAARKRALAPAELSVGETGDLFGEALI